MPEHGVGLVQLLHAARHRFHGDAEFLGQFRLLLALVRHELVQRRVDQADGDRESVHGLEDTDKVTSLKR